MNGASEPPRLVSVIVPTYEDPLLEQCLEALEALAVPAGTTIEVIVVDNGSAEAPIATVSGRSNVRLLLETRRGSYAARNTGVAASRGDVLAFTDSDCRPTVGWLREALKRLDHDPSLAAVAGRVRLDFEAGAPRSPCDWWEALESFPQEKYVESGFGVTANLVVRADALKGVGGFDAGAVSGGDVDFGDRLARGGHRLVYEADAVVLHPARSGWSELLRKARRTAKGRSRFEQLRGRDLKGFGRSQLWHLRQLRNTFRRAMADPALPNRRARLGYLVAGVAFRLVQMSTSIESEARYRLSTTGH